MSVLVNPSNLSIKTIKPQKIKWYKLQNDSFDARLDIPLDCPKLKKKSNWFIIYLFLLFCMSSFVALIEMTNRQTIFKLWVSDEGPQESLLDIPALPSLLCRGRWESGINCSLTQFEVQLWTQQPVQRCYAWLPTIQQQC